MKSSKRRHITNSIKSQKRGVTPQQAINELRKNGIDVDEEQAKSILDFLYILGKLAVSQYFNNE
jgi:hypothetical protein